MKTKRLKILLSTVLLALVSSPSHSTINSPADSNASTVYLDNTCIVDTNETPNCFTNTTDLQAWLKTTRKPNATNPIGVKASVGEFGKIRLRCDISTGYTGFITFQGAGRTLTKFVGDLGYTVSSGSCTDIEFSDLRIISKGSSGGGILWNSGGDSTWSNVDVRSVYYGWLESACSTTKGVHTWTGSTIVNSSNFTATAYKGLCDESWFYGSQISQISDANIPDYETIVAENLAEIHVYGSNVRLFLESSTHIPSTFTAIRAVNGGKIHLHGTGVDVISNSPTNITALKASNGGFIHANQSSYVLKTGAGGNITRIDNNGGTILAPYDWQPSLTPPSIISVTGTDTYTETDCDSSGNCDTATPANYQPHLMTYDTQCDVSGPWFNTVTKRCRGESEIVTSLSSGLTEPPSTPSDGEMFIELDCTSAGTCDGGTEPHLMIYKSTCLINGPWFDLMTSACRE